jgi:hypothetical protein
LHTTGHGGLGGACVGDSLGVVHESRTRPLANVKGGLTRHCLNGPLAVLGKASCFNGGVSGTIRRAGVWRTERHCWAGLYRPRRRAAAPPNKRMQLTKLRAAPVWQAEVPPCAPAGMMDGGTASQLIRSVRPTVGEEHEEAAPGVATARRVSRPDGAAAAPQGAS